MNMKKISRILSMVIVVGMIAAIPASTQILSGSSGESSNESNLSMLILVNRLELSEVQMEALLGILTDLLEEKEGMDALRAKFENSMIEFNGTGEELDELLASFREEQVALTEALRESIEASLDEARDLLSINQGIVLREALPELLGGRAALGSEYADGRLQNMFGTAGNRMLSQPMERSGVVMEQMQQAPRGGQLQMQSPMQGGMRMDTRSGSLDQLPDRFGQTSDARDVRTMMPKQLQDLFERFGDRVPEELRERMEDRFGGNLAQPGNRAGNLRSVQQLQLTRGGQIGEHGNLFELLEQVTEVLELKLGAME